MLVACTAPPYLLAGLRALLRARTARRCISAWSHGLPAVVTMPLCPRKTDKNRMRQPRSRPSPGGAKVRAMTQAQKRPNEAQQAQAPAWLRWLSTEALPPLPQGRFDSGSVVRSCMTLTRVMPLLTEEAPLAERAPAWTGEGMAAVSGDGPCSKPGAPPAQSGSAHEHMIR